MQVTFLDGQNQLEMYRALIEETVEKSNEVIATFFDTSLIELSVVPFAEGDAPKWGIGGVALSSQRVELYLDAAHDSLTNIIKDELPSVLAHEVHHTQRMKTRLPSDTLLQYLILEGLACHFEKNFNGGQTPSLFADIKNNDWKAMYQYMKPKLHSNSYSFDDYFLNQKEDGLPKYAGYWVGYNLVKDYLDRTNKSEIEILDSKAEDFAVAV